LVRDRPTGIAILAVLDGLGGVLALLSGVLIAVFGGYIVRTITNGYLPSSLEFLPGLISIMAVLFVPIGVLGIVEAYGLWNGKKWGWWITTILMGLGLVFGLIAVLLGSIGSIFGVIVDAVIVYYMLQKPTKAYFGMG